MGSETCPHCGEDFFHPGENPGFVVKCTACGMPYDEEPDGGEPA